MIACYGFWLLHHLNALHNFIQIIRYISNTVDKEVDQVIEKLLKRSPIDEICLSQSPIVIGYHSQHLKPQFLLM